MGGRRLTATARKFNNYKAYGVFSRHSGFEILFIAAALPLKENL